MKRDWDARKLARLEQEKRQLHLYKDEETVSRELMVVNKLPYKFSYRFEDAKEKRAN